MASESDSSSSHLSRRDSDIIWTSPKTYECGPGICVILKCINTDFASQRFRYPLIDKIEVATYSLKFIFTALGFHVRVYLNSTAADVASIVKEYSKKEHTGAFFLILLGHGGEGDVIYGADGREVKVKDIVESFCPAICPSLAGKPRVFMIDACHSNAGIADKSFTHKSEFQNLSNKGRDDANLVDFLTIFAVNNDDNKESYLLKAFGVMLNKVSSDKYPTDIGKIAEKELEAQTQVKCTFTRHYYITRGTELHKIFELDKTIYKAVNRWLSVREQTIQKIRDVAENLREHHSKANISKVAGSTIALGGLALIPLTFGKSFGFAGIGIALASLGGATVAGTLVVDRVIENLKIEVVQTMYHEDQCELNNIQEKIEEMKNIIENVLKRCFEKQHNPDNFVPVIKQIFTATDNLGMKMADLAVSDCLDVGVVSLKDGAAGATMAINAVLIPIDIFEVIQNFFSSEHELKTKVIEKLLDHASKLEEQMKSVEKILKQ